MAIFDYTEAHAVAVELITFFGEAGSLVKKGNDSGLMNTAIQQPQRKM